MNSNTIISSILPVAYDLIKGVLFDTSSSNKNNSMLIRDNIGVNQYKTTTPSTININIYFNVYPSIKSKDQLIIEGRSYEDQY